HRGSGIVSVNSKTLPDPLWKTRDRFQQRRFSGMIGRLSKKRFPTPMHRRISSFAIAITLSAATAALAQPAPVFTTEDMLAVRSFAGGQPIAVSPDGRRVAYVLTDQDDEWNIQEPRPTGHVVVQTIGDHPGAPRPLTSGA